MFHFVVPCGAAKQPGPAPAAELYTGAHFGFVYSTVVAEAAATQRDLGVPTRVWILSALHGLVAPDKVLAPYDVTMRDPGSVDVSVLAGQARVRGLDVGEVYGWLPAAYRDRLAAALSQLGQTLSDVYEAAPGIGFQRGVCGALARTQELSAGWPVVR